MNILGITFYSMTAEQIVKRNMDNSRHDRFKLDLPSYVFYKHEDGYRITESDEYFQFFCLLFPDAKNEKFILFDLTTSDNILTEEMSNLGETDFLEMIGFVEYWDAIKDKILIHEYRDSITIAMDQFFILKIETFYDSRSGEHDYEIILIGYLNQLCNLVKL